MKSSKKKWVPEPEEEHNPTNPELAAKLREWGENYGLDDDPYLEGLSVALDEGKDLAIWASNDVMTLMPEPHIDSTEGPIYSLMVLVRNVLVFVPVALTWLAVGKATTGFSAYTARSSAASVVNFLQFWQNGYGVLGKVWTLSHVAEDDFYIIATVILLTFVTPFMNRAAVRKAESFENEAMRERLGLVIEVESFLFDKRAITPMTMNAALTNAIESITSAASDLRSASSDRAGRSIDAPAPYRKLESVAEVIIEDSVVQSPTRRERRAMRRQERKDLKVGTVLPLNVVEDGEINFGNELDKKFKKPKVQGNKGAIRRPIVYSNQAEIDIILQKIHSLEQSLPHKAHARYEIKEMQRQLANAQKRGVKMDKEYEPDSKELQRLNWKEAKRNFTERMARAEQLSLEVPEERNRE